MLAVFFCNMHEKDPFAEVYPFLRRRKKKFQSPAACNSHDENLCATNAHTQDFASAMRDVRPLKNRGRDVPRNAAPHAVLTPQQQSFQELLENTLEFALSFSEEYIEGHVVGLERGILQKLRARQYSPEAHLDLHGLNANQAFNALVGFVRHSWHRGMRTLLLIPGRGKNSWDGVAVLRERVQSWLTQDPLKRVVLAFCTAKPVDGGPGSLYVLLRKYKKRGKIYWERCPADLSL
jgi:DNA-nicking Smr family endonuclease